MSIPGISDAEWAVMDILWDKYPMTANDIIISLAGKKKWNPRTIKTLLGRLVAKKVILFVKEGRHYKYEPVVKRNECVRIERSSFLEKVYNGAASPMLAAFIKDSNLSRSDIVELKMLLDRKEKTIKD